MILWSASASAQDLTFCGSGFVVDLSVGYTPTSSGLRLCGCEEEISGCELVHIVLSNRDNPLDCSEIIMTERWWREGRDLVDMFDAFTCTELPESPTHQDRYIIDTRGLSAGDTITILVCKTDPEAENIIEVSAIPHSDCNPISCPPTISCPIEEKLYRDTTCLFVVPDYRSDVILTDTCSSNPMSDISDLYMIIQSPPPGTIVDENLFVELQVIDDDDVLVTTCDVSLILVRDNVPFIEDPDPIDDISIGEPMPPIQDIVALDTIENEVIIPIDVITIVDSIGSNLCDGYTISRPYLHYSSYRHRYPLCR